MFEVYILKLKPLYFYSFFNRRLEPEKLSLRLLPLRSGRVQAAFTSSLQKTIITVMFSNLQEKFHIYFSRNLSASKTPST